MCFLVRNVNCPLCVSRQFSLADSCPTFLCCQPAMNRSEKIHNLSSPLRNTYPHSLSLLTESWQIPDQLSFLTTTHLTRLGRRPETGEVAVVLPRGVLLARAQSRSDGGGQGQRHRPGIITIPKVRRVREGFKNDSSVTYWTFKWWVGCRKSIKLIEVIFSIQFFQFLCFPVLKFC